MKMKQQYRMYWVIMLCALLPSCKESTSIEPTPDIKGDCSLISETLIDTIPRHLLGTIHPVKYPHSSSINGTYLLYSDFKSEAVYQMNRKTGEKIVLNFKSMLPENMKFEFFNNAVFCPYDDNLFMVHLGVSMDTTNKNQNTTLGYHIFIYDAKNLTLKLVTPSIVGKFGNYFGLGAWVLSSTKYNNNIFIYPLGIFNLESNQIVSQYSGGPLFLSPNGVDKIFAKSEYGQNGATLYKHYFNDIPLDFDPNYWSLIPEGLHFSQDGKYLLFTTSIVQSISLPDPDFPDDPVKPPKDTIPYAQKRFMETFIVDVEKTKTTGKMVLHNIVRYRRDLCLTGVYWHARFLTPRSYVISYRYNNTELHQLHEISIDGKILGQVTR